VDGGLSVVKAEIGTGYPMSVYDVMGSLIYNMGLASLRRSLFYQMFRKGDYRMAILLLPFTASRASGLRARREAEQRMLVRDYLFRENRYRKAVEEGGCPDGTVGSVQEK
jgi:GH24 family phage-related lysozyme (muramidase)